MLTTDFTIIEQKEEEPLSSLEGEDRVQDAFPRTQQDQLSFNQTKALVEIPEPNVHVCGADY